MDYRQVFFEFFDERISQLLGYNNYSYIEENWATYWNRKEIYDFQLESFYKQLVNTSIIDETHLKSYMSFHPLFPYIVVDYAKWSLVKDAQIKVIN